MDPTSRWHASLPGELLVGPGSRYDLAGLLPETRVLVVVSRSTADLVGDLLPSHAGEVARVVVHGEPVLDEVAAEVARVRPAGAEVVLAVGGGSVLDTGKALAAFLPNDRYAPRDHLEVVGAGHPLQVPPLPVVALPTTAGTGAEATHNAVLAVPDAARKVSLRDRRLTPRAAVVDPDLGRDVPHHVAVAAGLDAAVQLVEAAASPLATPLSTMVAMEGAAAALPALDRLVQGAATEADRTALAYGALLSGIALANGKLGTIHGFAGVLGGHRDLAHGALCGWFAAPVLRATIAELRGQAAGGDTAAVLALDRYGQLADLTTDARPDAGAQPEDLAGWFDRLVGDADLPRLDLTGLPVDEVVTAVQEASSTKGNPVTLQPTVLRDLLVDLTD
ncbi:MAG: iron-containing alcohol dehydrogenase [Nitriliruptoraceae bacterium]